MTCLTTVGYSQHSFSDDFEAYEAGDYLAQSNSEWTTWGGTTGTSEDVQVVDENAYSGTKSLKFVAQGSGGPQDLVKYFGEEKLTTGQLVVSAKFYVENGAYFNFQGEKTIGQVWSMNAFFTSDGTGNLTDSNNNTLLDFNHPIKEWFEFKMNINFDANSWQLEVDGECVGAFENASNSIASMDIFPVQNNLFFLDDFSYDYNPEPIVLDADASNKLSVSSESHLAGTKIEMEGVFKNLGTKTVESFEVESLIEGEVFTFSKDSLSLATGETYKYDLGSIVMPEGRSTVQTRIVSVNEGDFTDLNGCNDISTVTLTGFVAAEDKVVIVEEATGTWCGWCPRGAVALDFMAHKYGDRFVGIAVHNGDPMSVSAYDSGLNAPSYPNATVNRGSFMDPASIEGPFLEEVAKPAITTIEQGADWDPDTRELRISMKLNPVAEIAKNFNVNIAIVEDGVTGTGSGYAQSNYYSGGSDLIGIDGVNWKDLPSTVPAVDMVYDHVGRAILAPFTGLPNSFDEVLAAGDEKIFNFTYKVPEDFDIERMSIVSMLITPAGTINTGKGNTVTEAVENGFIEITSTHDITLNDVINVFSNPMTEFTNVRINLTERTDVNIEVMDMTGKMMMQKNYVNQNGLFSIQLDTRNLPNGTYFLKITNGERYTSQKISVAK